ncbi:MAG: hypothetical protein V2A79_01985 [Planctomycetota bacterium]
MTTEERLALVERLKKYLCDSERMRQGGIWGASVSLDDLAEVAILVAEDAGLLARVEALEKDMAVARNAIDAPIQTPFGRKWPSQESAVGGKSEERG